MSIIDNTEKSNPQASSERLNALSIEHRRRLRALELQEARMGAHTPPYIQIEIEQIQAELRSIEERLSGSSNSITKRTNGISKFTTILPIVSLIINIVSILLFLIAISQNIFSPGLSTTVLEICAALLVASLLLLGLVYITSRGDPEQVNRARTGITTILIGLSSLFAAIFAGLLVNIASENISQIMPSTLGFIGIIVSLTIALLGILSSVYFYAQQKNKEKQSKINEIRDQRIVADKQDNSPQQSEGRS